jgi:hypothetical protein
VRGPLGGVRALLSPCSGGAGDRRQPSNEEGGEGGEAEDPVEALKVGLGKAGVAAIDFFYDLSGMYDGALRDAIKVEPILSQTKWQEVANFDGFKDLVRQLQIHNIASAAVRGINAIT